jgi:hypothetical protein
LSAVLVNYGGSSATAGVCQTEGDRTGLSMTTTTAIATSPVYNFCLLIMSGIIGANSPKMLPISALGSPIRVEYFLSANDDAVFYGLAGAGAVWQMVNVELELCYVNIDIQEDLIPRNEPIYISTSTYRQASQTLTSTQSGEFTTLLPFRFSSLNAIYGRFRNQASAVQGANATASARLSSSINPNFGSFYFRTGQLIYPPKPVYCMNGYIVRVRKQWRKCKSHLDV